MENTISTSLRYPLEPKRHVFDRIAVKLGFAGVVRCTVCGALTSLRDPHENLRETCHCRSCGAKNRHRQIGLIAAQCVGQQLRQKCRSLRDVARMTDIAIYNTEARGPVHARLSSMSAYKCSEFIDPAAQSGDVIDGVMHQDLMRLSFDTGMFDLVLSGEVFEHVPDPYRAHGEVLRVLKPGGRHIFTVPFHQTGYHDEVRASADDSGETIHHKDPIYHYDPVKGEESALVYTIFGLEMLCRLKEIGFETRMYHLYKPRYGILGPNAVVFEAIRPP